MDDNSANETCKNGVEDWDLVKTTFFNHISGSQQTLKVKKCFCFLNQTGNNFSLAGKTAHPMTQ